MLPSRTETLPNQSSEDPPARSLADDPQNMVRDGFETIPLALQLLGPYVAHCHIGAHEPTRGELDENGQRQWVWRRTGMGEGLYDIPMMIKRLKVIALSVSCVCVSLSLCLCLSLSGLPRPPFLFRPAHTAQPLLSRAGHGLRRLHLPRGPRGR